MLGACLMLFQLISHTVNLLLHKNNSKNFVSQKFRDSAVILAISVSMQALHFRLVSCEGARFDCWIFVFRTILPFQKNFHGPFSHCTS